MTFVFLQRNVYASDVNKKMSEFFVAQLKLFSRICKVNTAFIIII